MRRYNPSDIEPKWQQIWEDRKAYQVTELPDKQKTYVSCMFPYPSGVGMHLGHAFEHAIVDSIARWHRQRGLNVLNPMGWDAFGLPTENYAIKTGTSPMEATEVFIKNFKNQIKRIGASLDWSREINTTDPEYYRWTQWIFTKLFERGLAYQKESLQWWCPVDKTVLANEQVEGGKCWRCGSEVEKKALKQWFFKITDYADALLGELDSLEWPEKIKTAQRNWIGKSEGAEIEFVVGDLLKHKDTLKFTPDLTKMILEGKKWSTIRLEPKELRIGDIARLQTRHSRSEVSSFALAEITNSREMTLAEIPNDLEGHEKYTSQHEKLANYRRYYGGQVTLETTFTIYDFKLVSHILTVFTTRPDTLFGATFLVLAPEHPLVSSLTTDDCGETVEGYVADAVKKSEIERMSEGKEKTGVPTGSYAINPTTGDKIPVWVADYVLGGYGTGAIMAVPGHDERDFDFANKFNLPVVEVIEKPSDDILSPYTGEGLLRNSGTFDGMPSSEAREEIVAWLEQESVGRSRVTYKMRDWLISRQRYWGAPIPIIHCPTHGPVAVPSDQLPVVLPKIDDYAPKGDGKSSLASAQDWVNTTCPTCGGHATRETDTMDGYACSSWYLLRYTDPHNKAEAWSPEKANYWAPVDYYVGGDHAVAHLLYVRFWTHVFKDMGLTNFKEPVKRLVYHGYINAQDGQKMSKSKGNVIDPLEVIDQGYGADALRAYALFTGPIEQDAPWDPQGITGTYRFLNRVWNLAMEYIEASSADDTTNETMLRQLQHRAIQRVSVDYAALSFNTALAALMEYVNELYKLKNDGFAGKAWRESIETLVILMAPMTPHIAAELWQEIGHETPIEEAGWPLWDEHMVANDTTTIAVQVDGKLRSTITVSADTPEEDIKRTALNDEKVKKYVGSTEPRKVIYVPGKLISIVN